MNRTIASFADAENARLFVVGGYSSLRPTAGAQAFGAFAPGENLGQYRLGDNVAVQPEDGGAISSADYAIGLVDLIEQDNLHRAHVNLAH